MKRAGYNQIVILLIFGSIVLIPVWAFVALPELDKIPINYSHSGRHEGTNSLAGFGEPLGPEFNHTTDFEMKVTAAQANMLTLVTHINATDTTHNVAFLDETRTFVVDRTTGADTEAFQSRVLFPPNAQKTGYFLTFPLAFAHANYVFAGEDVVGGLTVYVFKCVSQPYDITNAIPFFRNHTVNSFYTCTAWIEPHTGHHVKFELHWESYYMGEDGGKIQLAERGFRITNEETLQSNIAFVTERVAELELYRLYIPLMIAAAMLGTAAVIFFRGRAIANTKDRF